MRETSEKDIDRIYELLLQRIQNIGIALQGQFRTPKRISEHYSLEKYCTPSIEETEDAFMNWNCAIITAFRGSNTLTPEQNYENNVKRNAELKNKLYDHSLMFKPVNGCYREAWMEKPNVELCFFITNTSDKIGTAGNSKAFFNKIYRLAEYYEQDSFLFTFPGTNRVAFLVATNDDGRNEFRSDVKFAGPLFTENVPDLNAWTDCSDGRISFQLKGMIMGGGTGNKKIRIGEGNIFDVNGYGADSIIILRGSKQKDLKEACDHFTEPITLIEHRFNKQNLSEEDIRNKTLSSLKEILSRKKRRIGFHCSAALNGSYSEGAKIVLQTIQQWAKTNDKKFDWIVLVDIYGDYSRF